MKSKRGLYRFFWDCGRMGEVSSLFIANELEVEAAIGQKVFFGDILGKHSDVYGELEAEDVELITQDEKFLDLCEEHSLPMGYNPLDYLGD